MCHPGSREGIRNRVSHTCRSSFRPNARSGKSGTGKKDPFDIRLARPIYSPNNSPMRKWNMKKRNSRSFPSITEIFFWSSILSGNKRGLISRQKSFPFVYLVASTPSFLFFTPAIIHFPQPLDDVYLSVLSPFFPLSLPRSSRI